MASTSPTPRNKMAKKACLFRFQRETGLCFYPQKTGLIHSICQGAVQACVIQFPLYLSASLALLITSEPAPLTCVFPQMKSKIPGPDSIKMDLCQRACRALHVWTLPPTPCREVGILKIFASLPALLIEKPVHRGE